MRGDLPLGLLAAQIVHAAGESGPAPKDTHAVVLVSQELEALELRLLGAGFKPVAIYEEGIGLVAMGLPPARKSAFKLLSSLPLLREGGAARDA